MDTEHWDFLKDDPEGAVIVALDNREEGLLSGAVELQGGEAIWLDYELEYRPDSSVVSLYREAEDTPVLAYRVKKRWVEIEISPDRLLLFWNRGQHVLVVDGELLPPGEVFTSVPQSGISWLLRFASWLPWWE